MEDLISREVAIDALRNAENHAFNTYYKGLVHAHKIIAKLPSVQPEQKVIRCKDCKYVWKEDGWDNLYCDRIKVSGSFAVDKDGFCAWAKMEEGE